jgi:hypothetical protein
MESCRILSHYPQDHTRDSIGRLDNIQIIINNYKLCNFEPYKLTDECLGILLAMVKRWFNLDHDEDFEALVEICKESCPESARPI